MENLPWDSRDGSRVISMLTQTMAEVVVIEYNAPLRAYLQLMLGRAGYHVTPVSTFEAATSYLRSAEGSVLVIAGNVLPDNSLVTAFLKRVVEDEALARRHRYLLLTTTPEHLAPDLTARLARLDIPILRKPFRQDELLMAAEQAIRSIQRAESANLGADRRRMAG